jgi:hypothetical protein
MRSQGMGAKEAESIYAEWSEKATEQADRQATGYTPPREPLPIEE